MDLRNGTKLHVSFFHILRHQYNPRRMNGSNRIISFVVSRKTAKKSTGKKKTVHRATARYCSPMRLRMVNNHPILFFPLHYGFFLPTRNYTLTDGKIKRYGYFVSGSSVFSTQHGNARKKETQFPFQGSGS